MVKLNERYVIAGKVVTVHDVVYDQQNGNFIFYKEGDSPTDFLLCESERVFLSIATRYEQHPMSHEG